MKRENDLKKKSKTISYALRHHPEEFYLFPDDEGFVFIDDLLSGIKRKNKIDISLEDIENIIRISEKKRFEIRDKKIRACYGHSNVKVKKEKIKPPDKLYHGTGRVAKENILIHGLLPMKRQYVHLSSDIETALKVGKRKDDNPVVFEIDAKCAYDQNAVEFFYGNDTTYLSGKIPPEYIKICLNI